MAEELRIIVTDQGAGAGGGAGSPAAPPSRVPSAPATGPGGPSVPMPPPSRVPSAPATGPAAPPVPPPPPSRAPSAGGSSAGGGGFTAAGVGAGIVGRQAIQTVGRVGTAAASGSAGAAAAALGGALSAIAGPVGIAFAAVTVSAGVAAVAIRQMGKAIQSNTEALKGFSQEVAQAAAETMMRRFEATQRRAQAIGPELARAEGTRSRFEEALTDLQTELLEVVLRMFNRLEPAIDVVIDLLKIGTAFLDKVLGPALEILVASSSVIGAVIEQLFALAKEIARRFGLLEADAARGQFAEEFMQMMPGNPGFWPQGQPLPRAGREGV